MEISVGSFTFRLEIVILFIVILWIMFGHMLCSCCTLSISEGFEILKGGAVTIEPAVGNRLVDASGVRLVDASGERLVDASGRLLDGSKTTEGFVGSNNTAYGPEFAENNTPGYILSPDKWTSVVTSKGDINKQQQQQNPDEMDIFAGMQFKPECCPNTYSSSEGCACLNEDAFNLLKNRGGNNVPYSEY